MAGQTGRGSKQSVPVWIRKIWLKDMFCGNSFPPMNGNSKINQVMKCGVVSAAALRIMAVKTSSVP
jgi:hypothetical protein